MRRIPVAAARLRMVFAESRRRGLVERIADAQLAHAPLDPRQKSLGDAFLNQQPRSRAADLSLIEPDGIDQSFNRRILIGILEDDERRFAAQFQR